MNSIILCWPTAVVLLTFVDYASLCKNLNMMSKIIFIAIEILVIFWHAVYTLHSPNYKNRIIK